MSSIDLQKVLSDPALGVKIESRETTEEIAARLEREKADAEHKRAMERAQAAQVRRLENFAAVIVLLLLATAIFLLLKPAPTETDKEIAKTIITTLVGAVAGYGFGSSKSKPSDPN